MIFILFPAKLFAISFHCVSTGPNGEVTTTWDNVGTSGVNFRAWHIHYSDGILPFILIDSVTTYAITNYTDVNANAISNQAYYFITFESNNGSPNIISDTIRAINLNLNNLSGFANLSWNQSRNPLVSTNFSHYVIYRMFTGGAFIAIDSIDASIAPNPMLYNDIITICDDTIKYMIEVRDSSGCISRSAIKADRFSDAQVPAIPVLDSVSVDLSGNATITWQASTSSDTRSYVILQNPGPVPVDTVIGFSSVTLNSTISAQNGSVSFIVIAVDSCNNPSGQSLPHASIFLNVGYNLCTQATQLSWSPYIFWGASPQYNIFVSINGLAETFIGTTTQTIFNDTNLISGATFCYRVQAAENGGIRTTTSNSVCFTPNFPPPPAFSYIRSVTVTGTDQISIAAFVDSVPTVTGYELLRSLNAAGPFSVINSIFTTGVSTVTFIDNVQTDEGPYYYMISTIDSCGQPVLNSQVSNTILLSGNANTDFTNSLDWTNYSSWPAGVDHYNIYLITNGILNPVPVATLTSSTFDFLDSVMDNFQSDGEFCYIIEAIEAPGNPNLFSDSSRSNEICLIQQPIIFIPNAFHPGGIFNEVFLPANSFVPMSEYTLTIYNRWGEDIFQTNDPLIGWDGTTNGKDAPEAVYIYQLKTKNNDGSDLERTGSVTLIR